VSVVALLAAIGFSYLDLPAINALLNATATVLLVAGLVLIKSGRPEAHKRTMLSAFVVSVLFLVCYLAYHYQLKLATGESGRRFGGGPPISYIYYTILISHVLLAVAVPVLALRTIFLGLRQRWDAHRRWARWTFPIWLYVSITGVVIYVMLYHLYQPIATAARI
jgi:uncharacterized membrane protein YozB (DUF420 family)